MMDHTVLILRREGKKRNPLYIREKKKTTIIRKSGRETMTFYASETYFQFFVEMEGRGEKERKRNQKVTRRNEGQKNMMCYVKIFQT